MLDPEFFIIPNPMQNYKNEKIFNIEIFFIKFNIYVRMDFRPAIVLSADFSCWKIPLCLFPAECPILTNIQDQEMNLLCYCTMSQKQLWKNNKSQIIISL